MLAWSRLKSWTSISIQLQSTSAHSWLCLGHIQQQHVTSPTCTDALHLFHLVACGSPLSERRYFSCAGEMYITSFFTLTDKFTPNLKCRDEHSVGHTITANVVSVHPPAELSYMYRISAWASSL
jgi:hypothetical protein